MALTGVGGFDAFPTETLDLLFVTMTEYRADFPFPVLFGPIPLDEVFGEVVQSLGMSQLRIAETEKYAHVTFFFNGGREDRVRGRGAHPRPVAEGRDLRPAARDERAGRHRPRRGRASRARSTTSIVVNFANTDMVGHTGKLDAAIRAVECVDALDRPDHGRRRGARRSDDRHGGSRQLRADARLRDRRAAHGAHDEPGARSTSSPSATAASLLQGGRAPLRRHPDDDGGHGDRRQSRFMTGRQPALIRHRRSRGSRPGRRTLRVAADSMRRCAPRFDFSNVLSERIGPEGIARDRLDAFAPRVEAALRALEAARAAGQARLPERVRRSPSRAIHDAVDGLSRRLRRPRRARHRRVGARDDRGRERDQRAVVERDSGAGAARAAAAARAGQRRPGRDRRADAATRSEAHARQRDLEVGEHGGDDGPVPGLPGVAREGGAEPSRNPSS